MLKEEKIIDLATRVAWLHYIGGHTQASISKQLGFSTTRINRLLSFSRKNNITQFSVEGNLSNCIYLENKLKKTFGFTYSRVAPDLNEDTEIPIKTLGIAGADYLVEEIDKGLHQMIGLGYGKTLSSCINNMKHRELCDTKFVSLSGGLTPEFTISPYDIIHRIAYRINAKSYIFPSPMYLSSISEKKDLLAKPEFKAVFNKMVDSSLKFVGIGTVDENASSVKTGTWVTNSLLQAKEQGAAGEILGHFFDKDGNALNLPLTKKMITPTLSSLKKTKVVAIAGGEQKSEAILAIAKSGYLDGLITDEKTAEILLKM